jgi:hypothetical protein
MSEEKISSLQVGLSKIQERVKCTNSFLLNLRKWMHQNVFCHGEISGEVKEIFFNIQKELKEIDLFLDDLRLQPLRTLSEGLQLSRDEFYILSISGWISHLQSERMDAYEEFSYYYYKDDIRGGYINPRNRPHPPLVYNKQTTLQVHWGLTPEDIKISNLKKEQRDFFEKYEPELFSRFKEQT